MTHRQSSRIGFCLLFGVVDTGSTVGNMPTTTVYAAQQHWWAVLSNTME
jgi:hypothetical protein